MDCPRMEGRVWWKSYPRILCAHSHPWIFRGWRVDVGRKVILEYNVHTVICGLSEDGEQRLEEKLS